jgi:hypothetical protein
MCQVRQCLIYDAPTNPARLIGVEYMITPRLYETLDKEERKLWHSHDFEVGIFNCTSPFRTFLAVVGSQISRETSIDE